MRRLSSQGILGVRLAVTLSALVIALLAAVTGVTGTAPVAHADPSTQKVLALPFYQEAKSIYCGPASAQMTLKFLGASVSQATLAGSTKLATDANGGTPWYQHKMGTTLNAYQSSNYYAQVDARSSSESAFSSNVTYDIANNWPVVIGIQESPTYNINYWEGRNSWQHYIVIDGIYQNGNGGPPSFHFSDPGGGTNWWLDYSGSQFQVPNTGWVSLDTAWNMMYQGYYGWVW